MAPKIPQPIFHPFFRLLEVEKKTGLSAFSTFLTKKHGKGDFFQAIYPFLLPCFCCNYGKLEGCS